MFATFDILLMCKSVFRFVPDMVFSVIQATLLNSRLVAFLSCVSTKSLIRPSVTQELNVAWRSNLVHLAFSIWGLSASLLFLRFYLENLASKSRTFQLFTRLLRPEGCCLVDNTITTKGGICHCNPAKELFQIDLSLVFILTNDD